MARVAYVTGGMGGIGTSICQRLHKDGYTVIAGCGPSRDFNKWIGEQKALGYTFYTSVGNVSEWDSTVDAFKRAKAEHGRSVSPDNAWVIGEDSGIEVMVLDGRPGIASARWAHDGVARLLEELAGVGDRRARYVCTIVAIGPGGQEVVVVEGSLDGVVTTERSGDEGFGYDPVFVPEGETQTVAELGDAWKAVHSHRARAATALAAVLLPSG